MRRLLVSLVATSMCVAVLTVVVPVQAQMRGRAGFGRSVVVRPGFRGGFVGGVGFSHNSGVRVFVGSRGFFRPRIFPQVYWAPNPIYYGGYGYGYPVVVGAPYAQPYQSTYSSDDLQLAEEVGRLKAEVEHLRNERQLREDREYEDNRPQQQQPQPTRATPPAAPAPPTTFVYRNGRREDVRSYAIVGQTLWILSEARARKIPLSEIDLEATAKVNEGNGIAFHVPGSRPQPAVQPESVQPKTVQPTKKSTAQIAMR
jgi:hypothetical protein